ncbi:MAG: 3'-5' exonuclease, partial [Bacteroidota bacterium]
MGPVAAMTAFMSRGSAPMDPANIQRNSWRSREDIVYACNAIFTKAFPDIPEAAVVLDPVRKRSGGQYSRAESAALAERSGILHWHFELEGKARFAKAWHQEVTAKAIAELLANPPLCQPKGEAKERSLRPGDIAVLCRSNRSCKEMATALAKQGLSAAIARTGLLQTAEATLVLACLKYMLDRQDSLSVAEILLFGERYGLPEIVEDRLDWLSHYNGLSAAARKEAKPWGNTAPLIQVLNDLRAATYEHATYELLNLLLERLDLRRIIVAWGDGEQRLSNLDELRQLAVSYEDNCHRQRRAASLGGFLLYLDGLMRTNKDAQGASERPEAVNVLTYHRSKGLEWPVVVCMDLDQKLRAEVWNLSVVAEQEEVDLDDPLAGRWLKYWVNPYGTSSSGIPWIESLKESVWQETATEEALAEEARLLYVGFTRARDYLILPTAKTGAPWLDRAFTRGGGVTPVLDPHTSDAPFDWQGNEVTKYTQTWTEPRNLPTAPLTQQAVPFLSGARSGRVNYQPATATEAWLLARYPYVPATDRERYFSPAAPDPATDLRLLSQAIARFLAGNYPALPESLQAERASTILENYLPGGSPDPQELVRQAHAFGGWLDNFQPVQIRQQVPLKHDFAGHQFSGWVNWQITLSKGQDLLIVDLHGSGKQLDQAIPLAAAQLRAWAEAAKAQKAAQPAVLLLHLPAEGIML